MQQQGQTIISLSWIQVNDLTNTLADRVKSDGEPEIIVALQRGGLVPGIIISHLLGIRHFISFDINRTDSDEINAEKVPPRIGHNISLDSVTRKDVLLVDDIVGTGATLRLVWEAILKFSPRRVRSLVCVVNRDNWDRTNTMPPAKLISYIGDEVRGWVVFPWEKGISL